jgi:hypothetical protein
MRALSQTQNDDDNDTKGERVSERADFIAEIEDKLWQMHTDVC